MKAFSSYMKTYLLELCANQRQGINSDSPSITPRERFVARIEGYLKASTKIIITPHERLLSCHTDLEYLRQYSISYPATSSSRTQLP